MRDDYFYAESSNSGNDENNSKKVYDEFENIINNDIFKQDRTWMKKAISNVFVCFWLVTIFTIAAIGCSYLAYRMVGTDKFVFDSNNKYKIVFEIPDDGSYYTIDFENNTFSKTHDNSEGVPVRIKEVTGVNTGELKNYIEEITSDDSNLTITNNEKKTLFLQYHCYWIMKIQTYDGKEYYVKNISKLKRMLSILGEHY